MGAMSTMSNLTERLKSIIQPISIETLNVSPELAETNRLLTRIAEALEALVLHGLGVDLRAIPPTPEELAADAKQPRIDFDEDLEELIAVVEELEAQGKKVPMEVYRRLGIDPPRPDPGDPTEEDLNAPQPRPEHEPSEDEIQSTRRPPHIP
jgi:hypothetical protein